MTILKVRPPGKFAFFNINPLTNHIDTYKIVANAIIANATIWGEYGKIDGFNAKIVFCMP